MNLEHLFIVQYLINKPKSSSQNCPMISLFLIKILENTLIIAFGLINEKIIVNNFNTFLHTPPSYPFLWSS